jgi:matrixin
MYEHEVDWAVRTWNAVQECTPTFVDVGSSGWSVEYNAQSMPVGKCGLTQYPNGNATGSSYILNTVTIWLNTNMYYYDGPVPSNAPSNSCDLRWTLLHETGHSYGEGHSSVKSDVMYPTDNDVVSIDPDAHHMLAAVYGYSTPSNCNSCQFDANLYTGLPPLHPMNPTSYQNTWVTKGLAEEQSVVSAANDSGNIAGNAKEVVSCANTAVFTKQMCVAG